MKAAPDPKDVQEFLFKQSSITQILDAFTSIPSACSLLAADKKRGLLYVGHDSKIIVLKPGEDAEPEWQTEINLPVAVSKIMLNCDCSYLAVASNKSFILIYDAQAFVKNNLQLLHKIRISSSNSEVYANDLRWNPSVPGMLCTVANDYTIGSFQIKEEKQKTIGLKALEKIEGLEVLCAAWSPKGKQIVVGCKNGNIVQLKPDLKVARTICGPTPYIGEVITILWISNYQFSAAYLDSEQRINVLIVDAPKGEANAIFTCYEDITYGMSDAEGEGSAPRYYFDYVPEWGLIIAASSTSSEIAVLGSIDGGATWSQWQLVDSGRAQLPLIHTTESYPVGLAIDKSPVRKLPWGADSTLPQPVPILHILGTSGQLCSFHMVNLTPNCPVINTPPTEIVAPPPQPRPSVTPSEMSMIVPDISATSTPHPKQPESIPKRPKPAPMGNIFGDSLKVAGFFQQPEAKQPPLLEQKPLPSVNTEARVATVKETHSQEPVKLDMKLTPVKEIIPPKPVEQKASIDDSICVRVYVEEQNLFEKELRNRLEPQTWECGTELERRQLVEKAAIIDQFLRELRETTNSLSSDIAYLKALLLQSFAWVEQTKSKNAATMDITTRNCEDSSKISDLQRLYYYTQTQLTQATKILDLEWSEHKSQEKSRMKIPSLEFVYQNLVLHNKIIMQEKSRLELLQKRWKLVARPNSVSGLNRSISNLHITSPKSKSSLRGNTAVIEARCKAVASKTLSFTQAKQMKLKQLLSESAPRIIKPVNRSPIQDRLEATLSSLASQSSAGLEARNKVEQPVTRQTRITKQLSEKMKQQSPLALLNTIVARIGSTEANNALNQNKAQHKLPAASISFPSMAGGKPQLEKKPRTPTITSVPQVQLKPDTISFGQFNNSNHALPNLTETFPKVDSIAFGTSVQKQQENLMHKSLPKKLCNKNGKETMINNDSTKVESNLFSTNTLKDVLSSDISLGKMQGPPPNISLPSVIATTGKSESAATFSFASPNAVSTTVKTTSQDTLPVSQATSAQTFSFASKLLSTTPSTLKSGPAKTEAPAQGSLDLKGLSLGLQAPNQAVNQSPNQPGRFDDSNNSLAVYRYKSITNVTSLNNVFTINETFAGYPADSTTKDNSKSSVIIKEVPLPESKVPRFTGNITQALPATTSAPLFATPTSAPSISMFGGVSTTTSSATYPAPATVTSTPLFGMQPTTLSMPIFSEFNATLAPSTVTTTAGTSSAAPSFYSSLSKPIFGQAVTSLTSPSTTSVTNTVSSSTLTFSSVPTATTTSIGSVFDKASASPLATNTQFQAAPAVSSASNAFGKPIISPPPIPFGSPSNTSVFGTMPSTSANTSIFGGSSTTSIFGTSAPPSSTTSIFGENTSPLNTFGTPSTGSIFDSTQKPDSIFGGTSSSGTTSFFGGSANTTSPTVGGSATGATSVFGGVSASTSPMAVGQSALNSQPGFGQAPTFGSKPVFGSAPMFGASNPVFGGGFGSTGFGATASPPAFGNPPAMGASPAMENNESKLFGAEGNSTFESLGSQSGGLTFSSLAQKSPEAEKPPVFASGSSFSSWR